MSSGLRGVVLVHDIRSRPEKKTSRTPMGPCGWKKGFRAGPKPGGKANLVLFLGGRRVVDDPRAKVLGLSDSVCLFDDLDLHEFTPVWLDGRQAVLSK